MGFGLTTLVMQLLGLQTVAANPIIPAAVQPEQPQMNTANTHNADSRTLCECRTFANKPQANVRRVGSTHCVPLNACLEEDAKDAT